MKSLTDKFIETVIETNPPHLNYLTGCREELTAREKTLFENYLLFLLGVGLDFTYIAECYNTIVNDIKREQIYFLKNKKYRYSLYKEVSGSVYLDGSYMEKYMYGLGITTFLWSNHVKINRYFAKHLPKKTGGNYLEIGPGHGLHFSEAMRSGSFDLYHGVDISPKSAELTEQLLDSGLFGKTKKYKIWLGDFLTAKLPGAPYNCVVMGEVIEHVENPEAFLQRAYEITTPDAFIYITTAINAPAIDHIYLLRHSSEFETLVKKMGFSYREILTLPHKGKTLEECEALGLPVNLAAVLKKR